MKRITAICLMTALMLAVMPCTGMAADQAASEWKYQVGSDGIEIQSYSGSDADIVIPPEIDGKPVVRLASYAFRHGTMRSVFVPDSVTHFGNYVFEDCQNLETVRLPRQADRVGFGVFRDCSSLRSAALPHGIEGIYDDLFRGCDQLTDVAIPYGAEYIGVSAFLGCHHLRYLNVPETVKEISTMAFNGDEQLDITYGGTRDEWYEMIDRREMPLEIQVWGTQDAAYSLAVNGTNGPVVPGQTIEITVQAVETEIPEYAALGVQFDLEGIETDTYQVNLTADQPSAVLTGTIAPSAKTARASLAVVGGRKAISGTYWEQPVVSSEDTRYDTAEIGLETNFTSVEEFIQQYKLPDGSRVDVLNADGTIRDGALPLATGNLIQFSCADGSQHTLETLIKGDVVGSGLLSLDQLTKIAGALTGIADLSALEAEAADLNGNGRVDLGDLVKLAGMLNQSMSTR